mgnify:CR=1 FL=1
MGVSEYLLCHSLALFSFSIAEAFADFAYLAVKGRTFCIMPEVLAVNNVVVLPGLFIEGVMDEVQIPLAGQGQGLLAPQTQL